MVVIAHVADTHLGFRLHAGQINPWKEEGKVTWYEDKFYQAWHRILQEIIARKEEVDCVVHAGDLFDTPSKISSWPPTETARAVLMRTLREFFEMTEGKIPFIVIDGNHGIYLSYRYSPLDSVCEVFPQFHFFSNEDLRMAIRENRRLVFKIEEKNLIFHLFPYFEYKNLPQYETAYNNWVSTVQTPEHGYINIAVVHGMASDDTLSPKIEEQGYDYVALGHDHIQARINDRTYNAGAIYPMNFGDHSPIWGCYLVDLQPQTVPTVTPLVWEADCKLIELPVEVTLQDATSDLLAEVGRQLAPFKTAWDGETAARVKVQFKGSIKLENYWRMQEEMELLRKEMGRTLNYNLLQFIWEWAEAKTELGKEIAPGTIIEYILEDPKAEFIEFVKEKVDPTQVDLDLLSELAVESIEKALKELEK